MKAGIMKPILHASAILVLAALAAAITWAISPPPDKGACDPATLKEGEICYQDIPTDREVLWIDARSRSDWKKNGLPGSILWNYDESEDFNALEAEAVMKIFESPYVVVYCADLGCATSTKIAQHIRGLDALNAEVHVLKGGWESLNAAQAITGP